MRIITAIALALLLLSSRPAFAGVTVVESTPSRLVFDWELTGFDTVAVPSASGRRVALYFDGGAVPTGDSAGAYIPAYAVHVGVPGRGEARFSVESSEVSVVRLGSPLRRGVLAADSSAPRFASRWLSEPRYGMLRGYRAAYVLLRPFYDMGRGRVQALKRARITVEFGASAHTGEFWSPRGEYERVASRLLLNFRVAQGWHVSAARGGLRRAAEQSEPYPFAVGQKLAVFRVGDGCRDLNEGTTNENSLVKIRGSAIRKILGERVRMSSVALYASHGGEMDSLVPPSFGDVPAGVYEAPLLRYDLNGDGYVDDGDYVVAYVSGASDWGYDRDGRRFVFRVNRYGDSRAYWLAEKGAGAGEGLRMGRYAQPAVSAGERGEYEANLYFRSPQILGGSAYKLDDNHEGGIEWVWKLFTPSKADTVIRLELPGLVERSRGSLAFRGSLYGGSFGAWLGSSQLCSNCGAADNAVSGWGSRELLIRYGGAANSGNYYELSGVHARYSRSLALGGEFGKLEVFSATDADEARYRLSNGGGGLAYIVRVPADGGVGGIELVDTVRASTYAWSDVGNEGVRYMAMLEKEVVDYSDSLVAAGGGAVSDARYQVRDLRSASNETDYLIITHADFLSAALKLAEHKAGMGFRRPKVVLLGDVIDQFGGGNVDPAAIRNFLYYVYGNWEGGDRFDYVALFGAGHYDYKGISSRAVNFMPVPYVSRRLNEDYYVFFDNMHPNSQYNSYYFMGRLPARSLTEANDMVEKIIETEDPRVADFDSWRGRVLLSADDDQQGAAEDHTYTPYSHTNSSELMSGIVEGLRPDIGLRKIYLFEYGWDERYFKPAATRAFINEVNSGVAVVNWFGHGAISLIADERLFAADNISALGNRKRYPLFSFFSCSVGKFDQPGDECLSSELVRRPMGGGIASVASAREVYADKNTRLAVPFFNALFDTSSGGAGLSFGGALARAKAVSRYNDDRYYILLGDPSVRVLGGGRGVDLEVADAAGARLDTLRALQQVTIKGRVSGAGEGFGGPGAYAEVTLFNPPQDAGYASRLRKDGGRFDTVSVYGLPGSPVFSAKLPVVDGAFEQPLRLPMNLVFGKPGVKLAAHVWKEGEAVAGAGYLGGLVFDGSDDVAALSDTVGPKISVRPVYEGKAEEMNRAGLFVRNRITAQLPVTLEVIIEDESGINKIGAGPDEGITMEVKGAMSKRSVNHLFEFDPGSFSKGRALHTFEANTLKSGTYELVISAQDLLGNVSRLSVAWDVVDPEEIKLDHVMNVPNPVKMGRQTRFYYTHSNISGDLGVDVTIRVYSLGGRLLSVLRNPANGEAWVPKDSRGNYLTPNVYLYQVTATSSANVGRTAKSKIKKLAVLPPK